MKRAQMRNIFLCAVILFLCASSVVRPARASEKAADPAASEVDAKEKEKPKNGWKKTKSKTFYYKNGRKQTGWCKIDKKYYYFDENGVLQKNKIVGTKKTGYYYVDTTGVRVTDKAIKCAVSFVMNNSSSGSSSKQRLRSCYNALCKYPYQRIYSDKPGASAIESYALYMFNNKKGNCYRYASALAYIARGLGYDSRVSVGGVTAYAYRSLSPHGWCEVKIDGSWKVCDCSMQRGRKTNLFLVEWKSYPFRIRRDKTYSMKVQKGEVSWK